jgi:putative sigma-54 modulation protein
MNVEYTGRQYEITPTIRKTVETGITKIRKILGDKFETKVVLVVEKHRHKAEITISPRNGPIVSTAEAGDMKSAVNEAFEHLEKQALKYKTRLRSKKRNARKKWNGEAAPEPIETTVGLTQATSVPVVVHKFPAVGKNDGSPLIEVERFRRHASHDARGSDQRSALSRPRRLRLS